MNQPLMKIHASRETQEDLLSAMAYSENACFLADDKLVPDDFYGPDHQTLFEIMLGIVAAGRVPSVVEVLLEATPAQLEIVGGEEAVKGSLSGSGMGSKAESYVKKILDLSNRRRLQAVALIMIRLAEEYGDGFLDVAGRELDAVQAVAARATTTTHEQDVDAYLETLGAPTPIVPSGLGPLDDVIGGYVEGSTNAICALSGHGKSAALIQSARSIAESGQFVLFVSLEMSDVEVFNRMASQLTSIPFWRITRGRLSDQERSLIRVAAGRIKGWPMKILTARDMTPSKLRASIRSYRREHDGVGAVFLENIQLWDIGVKTSSREREVAEASRTLKGIAQDEGTAMVLAAQMNNNLKSRGVGTVPDERDIRESTAPFHDASTVVYIVRPGQVWPEESADAGIDPMETRFHVAKNRNGMTQTARMFWDGDAQTFHASPRGVSIGDAIPEPFQEAMV